MAGIGGLYHWSTHKLRCFMKKIIIIGLLPLFWLIPNPGKAVVMPEHDLVSVKSIVPLQTVNLIQLDQKGIEGKAGSIPKIKEKFASKIVINKLKRYANETTNKPKINAMTIVGFYMGIASLLFMVITFLASFFPLAFMAIFCGILAIILCSISLKRMKRKPRHRREKVLAITGLMIGLVVTIVPLVFMIIFWNFSVG
jgi:hypothetical protein